MAGRVRSLRPWLSTPVRGGLVMSLEVAQPLLDGGQAAEVVRREDLAWHDREEVELDLGEPARGDRGEDERCRRPPRPQALDGGLAPMAGATVDDLASIGE